MKSLDRITATKVIGSAVVLLVLVVGYLLVLSPRLAEVDEITTQTEDVAANNQVVAKSVADLEEKKAGLDEERERARAIELRFPPTAVQSDMFADVRDAARRAGIQDADVTALTPTAPQAAGTPTADGGATLPEGGAAPATGLASMDVTATVTGTRDQLRRFLFAMETQQRAYLFETVGLSPSGGTDGAGVPASTSTVEELADSDEGEGTDGADAAEGSSDPGSAVFTLTVTASMFLLPDVADPDDPPAPVEETPTPAVPTAPAS